MTLFFFGIFVWSFIDFLFCQLLVNFSTEGCHVDAFHVWAAPRFGKRFVSQASLRFGKRFFSASPRFEKMFVSRTLT